MTTDGCRAFIFKLELTMEDGSIVEHTSNTQDWKCRQSPVVWDHLFHGETCKYTGYTHPSRRSIGPSSAPPLPVLSRPILRDCV